MLHRGVALFVGVYQLLAIATGGSPAFVELRAWGRVGVGFELVLAVACLLLAWGRAHRARVVVSVVLGLAALIAAVDAVRVTALVGSGDLFSAAPVPMSVWNAVVFAWLSRAALRPPREHSRAMVVAGTSMSFVGAGAAYLLGFILTYGASDYRRSADAVVVLGARVYRDGTPSLALADRTRTGASLVVDGYAPTLVVSGGPGDGDVHETDAMRRIAKKRGVPATAIVADVDGLSTRATAQNVAELARAKGWKRVIVVTHDYHLARTKLAFEHEGVEVVTVPAKETRTMLKLPYFVAREVVAYAVYRLEDVARS